MRTALRERDQERFTIVGTVKRYGGKLTDIPRMNVYSWQETILLVDVKDASTGELLTDHVWFKVGKMFENLDAQTGDTIQFDARVDQYAKSAGEDYHLERPTKLKIIASDPTLFPEETAREVGTGIEYAQELKEQYELERLMGQKLQRPGRQTPPSRTQVQPDSSEQKAIVERSQARSRQIEALRQAHKQKRLQLPPKLLQKGAFQKMSDAVLAKLYATIPPETLDK